MPYTYSYVESTRTGTVLLDGVPQFTLDAEINPRIHGHLATPRWLAALNAGDGSIDAVAKRVRITSLGFDETAKDDDTRDEVAALRTELAQELATGLGITLARARFLVGFLWRFMKKVDALRGRL